ncbi:MAG: hypothetical protein A3A33_04925 [Candidatus Yanofskybacteria bacterium RIFCSPLOWO2_01_FULL_49_25]|uniref:Uncharacterized protein n=1 Tax=Candidatus Yanofskybacteria bacterium RIFCSPLOWO2_01_FULL_49_25 TaxID=1802701 RepID=A0A1F8GQ42_9BACT|nr:MAG: hypothetical protein A3A33_04925 [Candidatus Yanofskybacteria bacterium RIFCSPLOWO2_01_FULL_49_25]
MSKQTERAKELAAEIHELELEQKLKRLKMKNAWLDRLDNIWNRNMYVLLYRAYWGRILIFSVLSLVFWPLFFVLHLFILLFFRWVIKKVEKEKLDELMRQTDQAMMAGASSEDQPK